MRDLEASFRDTSGVKSLVIRVIPSHHFSSGVRHSADSLAETRALVGDCTGVVSHQQSSPWCSLRMQQSPLC